MNGGNYHIYIYIIFGCLTFLTSETPKISFPDFWIPPNLFSEAPSFHLALIGMAMPSPRKNGENLDLFLVLLSGSYKINTNMLSFWVFMYLVLLVSSENILFKTYFWYVLQNTSLVLNTKIHHWSI